MTSNPNLIITGFMGTGKTSVARLVAQRLGREFVDMDDEIVQRAGQTIPEIFAQLGEGAFRHIESGLCVEIGQRSGLVVATGGGCLVNPLNRDTLSDQGLVICLDCAPEGIVQRLRGDDSRPMLYGDSPATRVRELLGQRQAAYREIPYHIDTTNRTIEQVADSVLQLYGAEPILWQVRTPTGNYPVHLVQGGLSLLGDLLAARLSPSTVALVSDENVYPLWGATLRDSLELRGLQVAPIVLPAGEQHKSLATVSGLYDRFLEAGLDRSGLVMAVGGGVITDMAGFAAATFMRGVPFIPVPTTLLGMIDASVGGKVAVDLPQGKNLVGAFVEPALVLLDPQVLETLPDVEVLAGLAEIIKAGVIADPELFGLYEHSTTRPPWREVLARSLQVKIDLVEEDPYERGRRAELNLGHTFAHAYEVLEDYRLHHGLAVSMGMARAAMLAEARGVCSPETRQRIIGTLRAHGLPVDPPAHDPELVYDAMQADKKKQAGRLRFVLPETIGRVTVAKDIPAGEVIEVLRKETP